MSGTGDGSAPLVGEDYQAELRRIAASAGKGTGGRPKKNPDPEPEVEVEAEPDEEPEAVAPPAAPPTGSSPAQYELSVTTPSGATLPVLSDSEVFYYEDRASRYEADHRFTSVTDLQDLDRVLSTELLLHRYDVWLTLGVDYWGQAVSEKDLLRYNKELTSSLQGLKKSMGLDKATRDKDQGADFVSWLEDTRKRAKAFGLMRNKQFETALILFHELIGKITLYENCDEIERKELNMDAEQVLVWIREDLIPRFTVIDEHFRNEGPDAQKMWIGNL